jgi:hypothetical protein
VCQTRIGREGLASDLRRKGAAGSIIALVDDCGEIEKNTEFFLIM